MRYFKLITIVFITALLASCGGGTTTSKTKTSIAIKLQLPSDTKKRTKSSPRFTIGNTSISKVQIGYGLTGGNMTSLDVTTEAENQSSVTISQLEAGKEYSFTVAAYSGADTLVCQGGDTLTIVPNTESDLTLTCSFQDKYAIENFVFNIETGMINETMTESDLEDYVADSSDFGVYNGLDRDAFISDFIAERIEMKDNGLSLISVQMLDPKTKSSKTSESTATAKVKYIYSDGSYRFKELWAAKIDDEWKLVGNGHSYDLSIKNQAAQLFSTASQTDPDKFAGITVGAGSVSKDSIASFAMSGDGISSTDYTISAGSDPIYAKLTSPSSSYYFKEINENMTMYGNASAVNDGDPYVFAITTVNSESKTDTQYIDGDGITAAEMEQDVFPTATVVQDNYCTKTVNLTMPTAYTPSWAQIDILVLDSHSTAVTGSVKVPINATTASVDMTDILGSSPQYSEIKLTTYDPTGRAFSTYYSFENLGISADNGCTPGGGSGGSDDDIVVDGYYNLASLSTDGMDYSVKFNGIRVNSDNSFYGVLSTELFSDIYSDGYYEPVVASFNSDGTPASAYSVQHTDANSENTMFRVKVFKTSDGSQFIAAGNYDNDNFVSVMKINAAGDDIDWIKKYQSSDTGNNEYHKFIDASLISDSVDDTDSAEEILLLIKGQNEDAQFNSTVMMLKVSSEDGSILNSSITTVTNTNGGIVPIKMAVIKPYDAVAVLAYTCADDGTAYSSLSILALDSELTLQNSKEFYQGFDSVMNSISDNNADATLLDNIDMAAGINGKLYVIFSENYSDLSVAEISTDLNEYNSAYEIQSVSFISMDNANIGYENFTPRIAVVTAPSGTENLIYCYAMSIGSAGGDIVITVYLPVLAQLTEAAFDGSSLANGTGYNWAIIIPNMQMPGGQLSGGAASSVFLTNFNSSVSVNVDGEVGDIPIDSATNAFSFSSYSTGDPLNDLNTIGLSNAVITNMNVEDIAVSSFSLTQRELSIMDLADMP